MTTESCIVNESRISALLSNYIEQVDLVRWFSFFPFTPLFSFLHPSSLISGLGNWHPFHWWSILFPPPPFPVNACVTLDVLLILCMRPITEPLSAVWTRWLFFSQAILVLFKVKTGIEWLWLEVISRQAILCPLRFIWTILCFSALFSLMFRFNSGGTELSCA